MTKRKQAEHNERACHYLNESGRFRDWTITTAFYSAIHYVDDCLFPGQHSTPNGDVKRFSSIDDYYKLCRRYDSDPKHELRLHLVVDNCPEISAAFKWLKDNSSQLRYYNYKIEQKEADVAVKYLREIKEFHLENS